MRICIVGAGAIGGLIGTRLAATGHARVSVIARGATLAALREHGWRLRHADGLTQAPAEVSDEPAGLGRQDLVIVAVKAPALGAVARGIAPLLGLETMVLPAMNGVPWWFGAGVAWLGDGPIESVDPHGAIAAAIPLRHVVGAVVHASASTVEPGLVHHNMGRGLIIGEPGGGHSERVERVAALLETTGFDVTRSEDVRRDIWYKLWGNMTMNPVSAITGASTDRVLADPVVRWLCSSAMREAASIGALLGCPIEQDPEDRHAVTADLGAFKTSMLQDAESGRPIELDAIVGAVRELGERLGVPTPNIDAVFGLARLFGRVHGIYPAGDR